ncbi:glycosyltransferase [Actinomycetospora callitridis]|uniref:glycosyltransferase n=1 Tax=Actinomycetospora callitridis TaxID=913944 RepID=UPI00236734D8|nr:glycosyltransferase [Actinomycetospora callitridis]MDD7921023.1 glycosyltransferase [Actinomycetospora callitridis]
MTAATALPTPSSRAHREPVEATGTAVLDVVVPVFDEERDLGPCVRRLHRHLTDALPYPFRVTVADNASTDATLAVADAAEFQADAASGQVRYYVEGGVPGGGNGPRTGDQDAGRLGERDVRGASAQIRTWVQAHFTPIDVGGRTVYDLGAPMS